MRSFLSEALAIQRVAMFGPWILPASANLGLFQTSFDSLVSIHPQRILLFGWISEYRGICSTIVSF